MPQSRYLRRRQIGRLTPRARSGHYRRRYREPDGPNPTPEGMIDQPGSSWPHRSSRDPGDGASPHALRHTLRERPSPTVQIVGASATPARSLAALPDDQLPLAAPVFLAVLASNPSAASSTMDGGTAWRQSSRGMMGQSGKSPTRMHGLHGRGARTISCRVPRGPNTSGSEGPRMTTTGALTAAAMWRGPLSLVMKSRQRRRSAPVAPRDKVPAADSAGTAIRATIASARAVSAGPPMTMMGACQDRASASPTAAKPSIPHRREMRWSVPPGNRRIGAAPARL